MAACPDAEFRDKYVLLAHKTMAGCRSLRYWLMFTEHLATWGRHSDAKEAFEKTNELFTSGNRKYDYHYQRALVCLRLDDEAKYRQSCRTMLNQVGDTDDPMAADVRRLDCFTRTRYRRRLRARACVGTKAIKARPDSDHFLNTLGAILYRAGRL